MEAQEKKSSVFKALQSNENGEKKRQKKTLSWQTFEAPRYHWTVLIIVSLFISLFLTPGLSTSQTNYTEQWIGKISTNSIRSPDDYDIEDLDATESKRVEVGRSIHPIYDFQSELGSEIQERIQEAFSEIQNIIYAFIVNSFIQPETDGVESTKGTATKKADDDKAEGTIPEDPEVLQQRRIARAKLGIESFFARITKDKKLDKELRSLVLSSRNDFNKKLHAVISEEDYLKLYRYHFSTELMTALQRVIGEAMSHKIINEKELMDKGEEGIISLRVMEGKTYPMIELDRRDVRQILDFKEVNKSLWRYVNMLTDLGRGQQELLIRFSEKLVQPNLKHNRRLTMEHRKSTREAVKTMIIPIKKGEMIIRDGERFEKRHITVLRGIENEILSVNPLTVLVGYLLFFCMLIAALSYFSTRNISKFKLDTKDMIMMSTLIVLFILMVKAIGFVANALEPVLPSVDPSIFYLAIPVAAGAALVRIVLNSEVAILFAVFISLLYALLTTSPFFMSVYALITGLVAADAVGQCRARTTLFFAGFRVALVAMLLVLSHQLYNGSVFSIELAHAILAALASGVVTGMVLTGLTPIVEFLFSYTTDIKLLELANLNHPLLKKLIVQAPGTYHHCIIVGSLVEAAAESIHANPLVARVAAYYHDIGKVKTPQYFGENQSSENPHDSLSPNMSVLVLLSHVKEGVEQARAYNLGESITDIIEQHHGTTLIRYFHNKAIELKAKGEKVSEEEKDFRYPGPKPQTREAGLVMLADSVEAATRSLADSSPERIQGMVQKIINMIFRDGQLNDCELTLKDLHVIARSFTQILIGINHNRPNYPEMKKISEKSEHGRANSQSTKEAKDSNREVETEDDEDLKRLGMS